MTLTRAEATTDERFQRILAAYRGRRALGLMRGLGLTLAGGIGLYMSATGQFFADEEALKTAELYQSLGRQNTILLAVGICAFFTLIGLYWVYTALRDLFFDREGFAERVRREVEGN